MRTQKGRALLFAALIVTGSASFMSLAATPVLAANNYVVGFTQCANNNTAGYGNCDWIGSTINAGKGDYVEGMAVAERLTIDNVPATAGDKHTLLFHAAEYKSGKFAYDFLTSWDQAVASAQAINPGSLANLNTCAGSSICSTVTGSSGFNRTAPMGDNMTMNNGQDIGDRITKYEAQYGDRLAKVYGNAAVSAVWLNFTGFTATTGDNDAGYSLTWISSSSQIMLTFAAHMAIGVDGGTGRGYGKGVGAGAFSGNPFHVSLDSVDGSTLGAQDNQVAGAVVVQAASLQVNKHVNNTHGGNLGAGAFTMNVRNSTGFTVASAPGTETGTFYTLKQGSYTITENTPPAGYVSQGGSGDCAGSGAVVLTANSSVCTITNHDLPATLVVKKVVSNANGGSAVPADFTLSVTGTNATPSSFAGSSSGTNVSIDPGSFAVSEASSSYVASYSGCSGTIAFAQTLTCTVTNSDQPGTLIVKKTVSNTHGGTKQASDFTINVAGNAPSLSSFPGNATGTTVTMKGGAYSVTEGTVAGYAGAFSSGCSGTMASGQTAYCNITNSDTGATLIVQKVVVNSNGGTKRATDFSFQVNGGASQAFQQDTDTLHGKNTLTGQNAGTYSVTEPAVTGYTATYSGCSGVVLANGGSATCTITNTDEPGTLIVQKVVVNDNGGSKKATDFTFQVNGGTAQAFQQDTDTLHGKNTLSVSAGTYTITEPAVAGYTASFSNCANVAVTNGGTTTCTITNDDQPATLTVTPHVSNDNNDTHQASEFTIHITACWADNGACETRSFAGSETGTTHTINAGAWNVSEDSLAGYNATGTCAGTAVNGGTSSCGLVNDDLPGALTVYKLVANDNGGTKQPADFTMHLAARFADNHATETRNFAGSGSGTVFSLDAAPYGVSEDSIVGYAASPATCSGAIVNGVTTTTCTITNDDVQPKLTVTKVVNNQYGGTLGVSDFPLFVGATSVTSGQQAGFNAGTYTISETQKSGYAGVIGGDCASSGAITLAVGDVKSCTITNSDIQPKLTVKKHVVNDNGGAKLASDFTLTIAANGASPGSFAGNEAGTQILLSAGSYSVSETSPTGYAVSSSDCSGTIAVGEEKTCTITNDDVQPKLTVTKVVNNQYGGTLAVSDFPLFVGATSVSSGQQAGFNAATYTISETQKTGYTAAVTGDCASDGTITLAVGDVKSCTITNSDVQPKLTVTKVVQNTHGGTLGVSDFPLFVGATSVSSGQQAGFNAATYTISETQTKGYNGTIAGDCNAAGSITLAVGDVKICTITNGDVQAKLTVKLVIVSTHGGTATSSDFTLKVNSNTVTDGVPNSLDAGNYDASGSGPKGYTLTISGDCGSDGAVSLAVGDDKTCTVTAQDIQPKLTVTKVVQNTHGGVASVQDFPLFVGSTSVVSGVASGFDAGTYVVTETQKSGYAGVFGGDCDATGSVTLVVGDDKACTLNNTDSPAKLIVKKHVVNDNGGSALASAFLLSVDGINASPPGFAGSEDGIEVLLDAGIYNVTETGPTGYAQTRNDCSGTIAVGDEKTCTITNDDVQPKLTVTKVVENTHGGTATVQTFPLFVGNVSVSSGVATGFDVGTYTVSETSKKGYVATFSGDCAADGSISLAVGDEKSCTLTNADSPAKLTVKKHVVNDNGGEAQALDFTLNVSATNPSLSSFAGSEDGVEIAVDAGIYSVSESGPKGYAETNSADCSGSIAVGETKTCTITNDDIQPQLTVVKVVTNTHGGTATVQDFPLFVGDASVNSGAATGFDAGTYTVSETGKSGYTGSFSGDCAADGSVSLSVGDVKSCTLTNVDSPAKLVVKKIVVNDNGGAAKAGDFTLSVTGTNPSLASFAGSEDGVEVAIDAGSYSVSESGPKGYAETNSADCSGSIAVGETKTCTITNDDVQPKLLVKKHVVNDNGGTALAGDFVLSVSGNNVTPADFAGSEDGVQVVLDAGAFSVSESGPKGYAQNNSADCSGTIGLGETKTCVVTNNDIQPTLKVMKVVVNQFGGTLGVSDFPLLIGSTRVTSGQVNGIDAGTYVVSETKKSGYTGVISGDCAADGTVTLQVGDVKTCTITNSDIQPKLVVTKHVVNDDGGSAKASDFTLKVNNSANPAGFPGNETGTTVLVNAGSYSVTETGPDGYAQTNNTCTGTIALGETKTCGLTNDDIAPILVVVKHVINDNGGTALASVFSLTVNASNPSPATFAGSEYGTRVRLKAGSYNVTEGVSSGYLQIGNTCSGTIAIGQTKNCTITNDDQVFVLTVVKHVINDNRGTNTAADFSLCVQGVFSDSAVRSTRCKPGSEQGWNVTLNAGAYAATETGPSGYFATLTPGCAGTALLGGSAACTITNDDLSPTRTHGFWQTHTNFTKAGFAKYLGGDDRVGDPLRKDVNDAGKLFGSWYSAIAKDSTGKKRSDLDQARMQLLQQLTAAQLNCAVFLCTPSQKALVDQANKNYASTSASVVLSSVQALSDFNGSGDGIAIPGWIGKNDGATPSASQALANLAFWDTP